MGGGGRWRWVGLEEKLCLKEEPQMAGDVEVSVKLTLCLTSLAFLAFRLLKSLQMLTAAMKLKDAYSLEEKL